MKANALVARNLRRLRVRVGLSQEILAVDAGIDRSYVSRLERGIENPTVAILEKIAKVVRADISDFFHRPTKGEQPTPPLRGGRKSKR
jgi:transcriptional regulator with XRE-family HTH domain